MAKFTVRVELRDSENADYEELHELMEANGFSKTITFSSGNTYELPNAEYNYTSNTKNRTSVADLAESVASRVSRKPKILVTESTGRSVRNLDEI
ncbi:type V toxin-antitoxin system endoribonuclease antitoxin GhoS [Citrobacter braakii]|uniref:type V toxin-antitoxin system endoribonuclease antitoxin GhoS n=1 Tax=Citrobacter braakii TaxID=57706 RepID=UPI001B91DF91|nr:type V toxin-antitoxin system endoribonuclease antitoxin GhoS [Citrobacter braakii]